jgi:hypothetical protein
VLKSYLPHRIEDYRKGQATGLIAEDFTQFGARGSGNQQGVGYTEFAGKLGYGVRIIDRQTKEFDAPTSIGLPHLLKIGHFFYTGWAPGTPEIDHQYLMAPLIQSLWPALGVGQSQRKQGRACP